LLLGWCLYDKSTAGRILRRDGFIRARSSLKVALGRFVCLHRCRRKYYRGGKDRSNWYQTSQRAAPLCPIKSTLHV
jgi:hypothetical protein